MRSFFLKNIFVFLTCTIFASLFCFPRQTEGPCYPKEVAKIFKQSCSVAGCHYGRRPAANLNLEEEKFLDSLVDVPSRELKELKLVDSDTPEQSYLLMKIKGDKNIKGRRMPGNAPALEEGKIQVIENWIQSFRERKKEIKDIVVKSQKFESKTVFWGTQLVNLPTPRSIGKGRILFRISHRFYPAFKDGYDAFFGLDGPAAIMLGLGYGLGDNLDLTLSRSNRLKEAEFSVNWVLFRQEQKTGRPVSLALRGGGSFVTQTQPGKRIFISENMRWNFQLSLARKMSDNVSILVVPSYSTNTDFPSTSSRGTFAIGAGACFTFLEDLSLILEWIPVISGFKEDSSGWGLGLEKKIGGHVFQVFALNTSGLTTPQFIPGGEFRLSKGEFRVGFNIFRWF